MTTQPPTTWQDIPGWTCGIDKLYPAIAEEIPAAAHVLELGSHLGRSACLLGKELVARHKLGNVYCVDTWNGKTEDGRPRLEVFRENVQALGLAARIFPIVAPTFHAWRILKPRHFHLVFVDASHHAEDVAHDLRYYRQFVADGGLFAGHDYGVDKWPGVKQAVDAYFGHAFNEWPGAPYCWGKRC